MTALSAACAAFVLDEETRSSNYDRGTSIDTNSKRLSQTELILLQKPQNMLESVGYLGVLSGI